MADRPVPAGTAPAPADGGRPANAETTADASPVGVSRAPIDSALPSSGARALAFAAIVVAGICGGLIGWKVTDLSTSGRAGAWAGVGGLVGALIGAGGVAVVAVLVLRAMGEWAVIVETGDPAAGRRATKASKADPPS